MARTYVSEVGSNMQEGSHCVPVVVCNRNQLPHSHVAVCTNSRPRHQVFHFLNYRYARARNLRACLSQACAEAARATSHAAATRSSSSARRASTIPAGSMALLRLPCSEPAFAAVQRYYITPGSWYEYSKVRSIIPVRGIDHWCIDHWS